MAAVSDCTKASLFSVIVGGLIATLMIPPNEADKNLKQANADLKAEIERLLVQNGQFQQDSREAMQQVSAANEAAKAAYQKATDDLIQEKKRLEARCPG